MRSLRPRFLAEAIGTYCLVFAGTGAIAVDQISGGKVTGLGVSLVFGLIVLAMIYAIGHVSGAHLNPAVTFGFYAAGRHPLPELLPYAGAQVVGALAASATLKALFIGRSTTLGLTTPSGPVLQSFVLELLMTAMLMFTIMGVATDDRAEGAMAGIAIGAVVALEAAFGGPISGASMNPARSFSPAVLTGRFACQWVYWVAPMLGAAIGARAYLAVAEPPDAGA